MHTEITQALSNKYEMMPDAFTKIIPKTHYHLAALMNHFLGVKDPRFSFFDNLFRPPKEFKKC